jgi:hypothetical protein
MRFLNYLKLFWPGALEKLLYKTTWDNYEQGYKQGVEDMRGRAVKELYQPSVN